MSAYISSFQGWFTHFSNLYLIIPNSLHNDCVLGHIWLFEPINPLGPKREQHQFSPNNINISSKYNVKVTTIT